MLAIALRRAEHHRCERHRIDAEVEQGAAAELGREQPVAVVTEELPVIGGDGDDAPERALREQLADLDDVGQEARPHRLHQEQSRGAGGRHQLLRLQGVHRERLLHEHRLAGVAARAASPRGAAAPASPRRPHRRRGPRPAPRSRRGGWGCRSGRRTALRVSSRRDPTAVIRPVSVSARSAANDAGDPAGSDHAPAQRRRLISALRHVRTSGSSAVAAARGCSAGTSPVALAPSRRSARLGSDETSRVCSDTVASLSGLGSIGALALRRIGVAADRTSEWLERPWARLVSNQRPRACESYWRGSAHSESARESEALATARSPAETARYGAFRGRSGAFRED